MFMKASKVVLVGVVEWRAVGILVQSEDANVRGKERRTRRQNRDDAYQSRFSFDGSSVTPSEETYPSSKDGLPNAQVENDVENCESRSYAADSSIAFGISSQNGEESSSTSHPSLDDHGFKQLCLACRHGELRLVQQILARGGVDVNQLLWEGKGVTKELIQGSRYEQLTPLLIASREGHVQIVRELCSLEDTDVNMASSSGKAPLYFVAAEGHVEVCRVLIQEFNAKIDAKGTYGRTPLHVAAASGHIEVVKLLISSLKEKYPSNLLEKITAKSMLGKSAQQMAEIYGNPEIAELLSSITQESASSSSKKKK